MGTSSEANLTEARAVRFFDAARVLHSSTVDSYQKYWEPLNHLFGMAAELALKSYLTRTTASASTLRKHDVRHNLDRLLEEAISGGLRTTEDVAIPLLLMSKAHAEHSFRYTKPLKPDKVIAVLHADPNAAIISIGALLDHASPDPLRLRGFVGSGQEWLLALPARQPLDVPRLKTLQQQTVNYQRSILGAEPSNAE